MNHAPEKHTEAVTGTSKNEHFLLGFCTAKVKLLLGFQTITGKGKNFDL